MNVSSVRSKLHQWVVGFSMGLAHRAIRHPKTTLAFALVITLTAAPGVLRLKLRTDGHALVSRNAPEFLFDQSIRAQFGVEDQVVVLVCSAHPDGLFNSATMQLVRELTAVFQALHGINASNVLSLATEPSFRLRPGTLIHQTLLEPPLKTKPELDQLRENLRRIELPTGTLVSFDGRSTALLSGASAGRDRTQLCEQILGCIAARGETRRRTLRSRARRWRRRCWTFTSSKTSVCQRPCWARARGHTRNGRGGNGRETFTSSGC
jgi:predicted exporter